MIFPRLKNPLTNTVPFDICDAGMFYCVNYTGRQRKVHNIQRLNLRKYMIAISFCPLL